MRRFVASAAVLAIIGLVAGCAPPPTTTASAPSSSETPAEGMSGATPAADPDAGMTAGAPGADPMGIAGADGGMPPGADGGMPPGGDGGMPPDGLSGMPPGDDGGMPPGGDSGMPPGDDGGMPPGDDGGMPPGDDGGMPPGADSGMPPDGLSGMPPGADGGMPPGAGPTAAGGAAPQAGPPGGPQTSGGPGSAAIGGAPQGPMGASSGGPGSAAIGGAPQGPMGASSGGPGSAAIGGAPQGPMGASSGGPGSAAIGGAPQGPMGASSGGPGSAAIGGAPQGPMGASSGGPGSAAIGGAPRGGASSGGPGSVSVGGAPRGGGVASGGPMGVAGGVPGAAPGQQPAAGPKTLLDQAKLAFSQGNNRSGFRHLYAHYLCGDSGPADVQTHMKWSSALRRPTVAVQFGIGIVYLAPRDYTGNPMAIGNDEKNKPTQTASAGRRRRGRGNPGGPPGAGGVMPPGGPMGAGGTFPPMGPMGAGGYPGAPGAGGGGASSVRSTLDYYTGELGETLLAKLEEKIGEGDFGDVQLQMGQRAAAPAAGFAGAGIAGDGADYAPGGDPMAEAGGGGGGTRPAKEGESEGLRPGITFLGTGDKEDLEKRAKEEGLDVLIVYEVNVKRPGKTGVVSNSTKIRVTLVERPQDPPIHTTAALVNVEVASAREKDKEPDPVDDAIEKLMAKMEAYTGANGQELSLKLGPMPANLTPQPVANRVTNLTSSASDHPLRDLAEIKFYHSKKLITDQQFTDAAKALLSDKAELLSKGKEDERRAALAAFLSKAPGR